MKNSIQLTISEVNRILVNYIIKEHPHLMANNFEVHWSWDIDTPTLTTVAVTEGE